MNEKETDKVCMTCEKKSECRGVMKFMCKIGEYINYEPE